MENDRSHAPNLFERELLSSPPPPLTVEERAADKQRRAELCRLQVQALMISHDCRFTVTEERRIGDDGTSRSRLVISFEAN